MNTQNKTIIGIVAFAIFLATAYMLYSKISSDKTDTLDSAINEVETVDAPNFTVTDSDGNKVKLSDFVGKPVVLNFWASWCGPCKSEMPHFNEAFLENKDDVVFLMVNLTDGQRETLDSAKKYLKKNGYTFTAYYDTEQNAANAFRVSSIPSTYFINKEGKIVKFKNKAGAIVTGYQGAIDKKSLDGGIALIK